MNVRGMGCILMLLLLTLAACGGGSAPVNETGETGEASATSTVSAGEATTVGDPAAGQSGYAASCAACHGPDARGIANLGKDLIDSEFVAAQSDAELIEFIKVGRDPSHPDNTTGIAMPPKGGNPALTDAQIADIVAWLRAEAE